MRNPFRIPWFWDKTMDVERRGGGVAVRKAGKRVRPVLEWDGLTQLAVLGCCFFVGALFGFFFSCWGDDSQELRDYLTDYFQMAGQGRGVEPTLLASIWDLVRWPLAAFLMGASALGAAGIPILMGARGFLLAFSAVTFARLFGLAGMAASLAAFGVTALLAVPVLFVVAADAFRQSLDRLSGARTASAQWGQRARALTPCAGLLMLAVALQQTVMPALFTAVCARLFIT